MAGYSGTPLAKKLGIKPGARVALVHPPPDLERALEPLPDDVVLRLQARGALDVILLFVTLAIVFLLTRTADRANAEMLLQ